MKKLLSLCLICLLAMSAMAQRAAVMEFKAGVGISQADVDGLSGIFTTYFRPEGYTVIERTQIDRIIDEQQLQRSSLTESQMVRIGELLNLSKIVIADVNIVFGQYNVDVRVIDVESGIIVATEGATFEGTSYRETMKSIAQKLAQQITVSEFTIASSDSEVEVEEDFEVVEEDFEVVEEEEVVLKIVETMPEFPGGQGAMMRYIAENLQYPIIAMENGIQGRVICQFVVEKDGRISNIQVIRSSGDASLDKEGVRVISTMPKWIPGKQQGKPVRVTYTMPLNFRLQ